jgi:hypothetical protein
MAYERDQLLKELRSNVLEVLFVKADGSDRLMRCTLRIDLLPATYLAESEKEGAFHRENKDIIACWDVERGGWRSFRIDSIKYASIASDAY